MIALITFVVSRACAPSLATSVLFVRHTLMMAIVSAVSLVLITLVRLNQALIARVKFSGIARTAWALLVLIVSVRLSANLVVLVTLRWIVITRFALWEKIRNEDVTPISRPLWAHFSPSLSSLSLLVPCSFALGVRVVDQARCWN